MKFLRLILCLCIILLAGTRVHASLAYEGVNLSGAEFGEWNKPGTYGTDYTYPDQGEVDYYLGKGMNTFRLPFLWERLQPSLSGGFDTTQLGYISDFVNATTSKGGYVILDPHNFAEYYGGTINGSAFASLWSGLATTFKDNDHVIFGLMNEPRGGGTISTEAWFADAQGAMNAIRATGATNLVLVPGNYYTGAWSWTSGLDSSTANSQVMGAIHDSANNFAFDVHQYLDGDYSGTSGSISHDPVATLSAVTAWLEQTGNRGFLGEFAIANVSGGQAAVDGMLGYLDAHSDVWSGWTWWGGGPWWGNYMFRLDPSAGQDAPQMAWIEPHISIAAVPEPKAWALLGVALFFLAARRCRAGARA